MTSCGSAARGEGLPRQTEKQIAAPAIGTVCRSRRTQRGYASTGDILRVQGLAQALCLAEQWEKPKTPNESRNLGNVFVAP
jgi:hypothetical protein